MKKILLVCCLLLFTAKIFAQQFSQYNTGTLYDSFENPSQRAFVPDTSKKFAFNFFVPNFNANFFLSGNGQASLKNRAFTGVYNNTLLTIGQGRLNHAYADANAYFIMLKMFSSLNGDQEIGFSAQTKAEGKGIFTDETIGLLNGTSGFGAGTYNNIFNNNYYYQTYNQFSLTYREKINKQFAIGFKLSLLGGVEYQKLNITSSQATFNNSDSVAVALRGTYQQGFTPGHISTRDYLPSLRNPGASISIGTTYQTEDHFIIQTNIKDLGFIHWNSLSTVDAINNTTVIHGLLNPRNSVRVDSIYNKIYKVVHVNALPQSFTTPVDGRVELSVMKSFWIDDDRQFKYSPTLIASKELFYPGFIGALVNPFQYHNYVVTATFTYDDLKTFNVGGQLMLKAHNAEFYFGSDKLFQSVSLLSQAINKNSPSVSQNSTFTGADFFLGFSLKFGPVIEHPLNASTIPTGEKGFLGRLWSRLFKTNE